MTFITLQESFEREINKFDDALTKPKSSDTEYFLNTALDKFWKTRYSQNNYKQEGFEQTQKRTDDLRTLVVTKLYKDEIVPSTDNKKYTVTIPDNYVILLGDTAGILPIGDNECWEKDGDDNYIPHYSDTIEGQVETIDRIKENSLSEYRLRYTKAKPIRLVAGNEIQLFTDGKYKISEYNLTYLRKPEYLDIHKNPFAEYTDMPEHTHLEIVKLAAQMYIENQANPRYNSYTQEVIPSME